MARTTGRREDLRKIPSVDALLRTDAGTKGSEQFGRPLVKLAINRVLDEVRASVDRGDEPPEDDVILARAVRLAAMNWYGLSPVINATGVLLHTGLGRAPLPDRAARAAADAAKSYADLELDRESGHRGKRTSRAETMLTALTRAEAALVVNNNPAALLLALPALARRRQ